MRSRDGGHHQCTVIDQECRQGARSQDASDNEGKVVFSVCSLVMPGLRADAVAKPTGMESESSVARYSAMSQPSNGPPPLGQQGRSPWRDAQKRPRQPREEQTLPSPTLL
jgi:hypothetical protein